ncbi:HemK2/MTQ2 family protein methyltransferase [Mycolicibacterium komossense]|uniref:Methyltransferase n=1 Tax=Mycolicibacterium komossense TaxID=1779 RepID=A0ABT3CER7_9MYCO|nr:HemK2/MTQ2 family protein methyltransferase [Mycolicibacterium komossense]MCV7227987.1 methyltransferase [Mycolicibacterium komossense]
MTTAYSNPDVAVMPGVYAPQQDSRLLIDTMRNLGVAAGRRVADLCTGSGVAALAAAAQGAETVTAFDVSPAAVRCARGNALSAAANVDVHLGSWARAREFGPFDLVTSNPPYVPHDPANDEAAVSTRFGRPLAWDAGRDGRLVLNPLCATVRDLLDDDGVLLLVHSEFAGLTRSLGILGDNGMSAQIVAEQWIPFGPVLSARAAWLEQTGLLQAGRRVERLAVIRAQRR